MITTAFENIYLISGKCTTFRDDSRCKNRVRATASLLHCVKYVSRTLQYLAATGHDEGAQGAETQQKALDKVREHVTRYPMILT